MATRTVAPQPLLHRLTTTWAPALVVAGLTALGAAALPAVMAAVLVAFGMTTALALALGLLL